MGSIEVVLDQWPVVFTKFDGDQTLEDLASLKRTVDAMHERKQRYVAVNWMRRYGRGHLQLRRAGEMIKETEAGTRDYCMAFAMVADSVGFRFLLSTVFLIRPLPAPYIVSATVPEALAFCVREAQKHGLKLPRDVRWPWPEAP